MLINIRYIVLVSLLISLTFYSNGQQKVEGNKAECTIQTLLDARIWGSRNTWRLQQTMQLEKRNDDWIILKSVATIF